MTLYTNLAYSAIFRGQIHLSLTFLLLLLPSTWFFLMLPNRTVASNEIETICWSDRQQSSCGRCIKSHKGCVWCMDPEFSENRRCDTFENLIETCPKEHIYRPQHKVDVKMDSGADKDADQLQPRRIHIEMRPGHAVSFPVRYSHRHSRNREVYMMHSETASKGLQLDFSNDCLGRPTAGRSCSNVRINDVVTFTVNVTLLECVNGEGDLAVTLGVSGARQVIGLYVSPICRCECENPKLTEALSSHCSHAGSLVCGMCVCTAGKSGQRCQCRGEDDKCRQSPLSPLCSGRGQCECGDCKCFEPDIVKGQFCECDITSCPVFNGIMCSGKGECDCGKCVCEAGRTGQICECPIGNEPCRSRYGAICSNHGQCQCGTCVCNEGYDGDYCETAESDYELDLSDETAVQTYQLSTTEKAVRKFVPVAQDRAKSEERRTTEITSTSNISQSAVTASNSEALTLNGCFVYSLFILMTCIFVTE